MFKKTIGILGGMGPVASADTYTELTKICQQKYNAIQDQDFPAVVLYSLPLDDFDHKGFDDNESQKQNIVKQLTDALRKLESFGADLIIIDCNTVHYFFPELESSVTIPIINLIQLTMDKVLKYQYKKVGILCSQASKDFRLYTKPLEQAGVEVVNTSVVEQELINNAILAVMSGQVTSKHIANVNNLIENFISKGAQSVILGCTEISNLAKQLSHHAVLLDSELFAIEKSLEMAR